MFFIKNRQLNNEMVWKEEKEAEEEAEERRRGGEKRGHSYKQIFYSFDWTDKPEERRIEKWLTTCQWRHRLIEVWQLKKAKSPSAKNINQCLNFSVSFLAILCLRLKCQCHLLRTVKFMFTSPSSLFSLCRKKHLQDKPLKIGANLAD